MNDALTQTRRPPGGRRHAILTAFGSLGDVRPLLAIGQVLLKRGYRVTMASHPSLASAVDASGIAFHPCEPDLPLHDPAEIARLMHRRTGARRLVRDLLAANIRRSYESLSRAAGDADVLLSNELSFAAPLVAAKRELPWISTVLNPMALCSIHDPPQIGGLRVLSALCGRQPFLSGLALDVVKLGTKSWLDPVLQLRAELGLSTKEHPFFEGKHSPARVLALFSPVFARPQPDWPTQIVQAGFCFIDNESCSPEVEAFVEQGAPPVVFTLGSALSFIPGDFFSESARAAAYSNLRAVLITGGAAHSSPRRGTAGSVCVTPFEPYAALFPRAAAVVHFGGAGVSACCLSAGKPALVVPCAHDQFDNAAHLAKTGSVRVLSRKRYRAARVAKEISSLISDVSILRAAHRASTLMRDEDGAAKAADAVDAIVSGLPSRPTRRRDACEFF